MSPRHLPGLIDCHVHFREPGLTHKADMQSESKAALAGGITTVCEMPNTIPPTVTIAALADKVRRAAQITAVDLRFYFGATKAAHIEALRELWVSNAEETQHLKARCSGVKLYLDHSTGNQKIEESLLGDVFALAAKHHIPLIAHCEDPATNDAAAQSITRTDIAAHSLRRPPESEAASIRKAINLAREYSAALHIAHLSTGDGIELVRKAKDENLRITCEVAPHHLFLSTADYAHLGTLGKMNPPLREIEHQRELWAGILDGTVDCIATDHAPHTLEEKQNPEPLKAPSGVAGVETMLPLLLSVAAKHWPHPSERPSKFPTLTHDDIVRFCFQNPNRIFNLGKSTDDATVEIDPDALWVIRAADLHSKCGWTPFEGWEVKGKVLGVVQK
jgi:dihydroorotase